MTAVQKAIKIAVRAHKDQVRKFTDLPYIVHPFDVLNLISRWGVTDDDMWCAAICHDVLEDSNIPPHELREAIGDRAFGFVKELTFIPSSSVTKDSYLQSWKFRDSPCRKSIESLIIKIADRIVNVCDFEDNNPKYARIYTEKAKPLFDAFDLRRNEMGDMIKYNIYNTVMKRYVLPSFINGEKL